MKLAVLFDHFGPYHLARLRAAAARCETLGLEFHGRSREYAWELADRSDVKLETLAAQAPTTQETHEEFRKKLADRLSRVSPDVVAVPGWSSHGALASLQWCAITGTPAVLMSESSAHDEPRVWYKELIKRRLVALASSALVGGRLHAEYLQRLGMPSDHVFTGYDVVDNSHFTDAFDSRITSPKPHFLASSRFVAKKNLPLLLRAFASYRSAAGESAWNLVLLGDGELRTILVALIDELKLAGSVEMPGFVQYDELPGYYNRASAFVHASTTEQWGLVVNEAVASGLPVIVSNRCGCAPELVQERVNGLLFDPADQSALTECFVRLSALSNEVLASYSRASSNIAAQHDAPQFGEGVLKAATLAMAMPHRRIGRLDQALLTHLLKQ